MNYIVYAYCNEFGKFYYVGRGRDFEATLKDTARKRRDDVRKPLRDKVRSASRKLSKG